ncbi:MAG: BTAD domain-containing putative transcriptional regulator [Anaerolineae bacterium]
MIRARLRLLGGFRLTAGPDPHAPAIDLASGQSQMLLAYLALHPERSIDRRWLAFNLWPDAAEGMALRNLRQHLHRLRQILASLSLPDDMLLAQSGELRFQPSGLWVDADQFQRQIDDRRRQIEAIEFYRGDLLAGHDAAWLHPIRARLRDRYLEALRTQIAIANMQRNYPRALYYARRLLQAGPLRESSHRIFMEALYFNGNRAQALRHFAELESLLQRELNAGPMPETVALYRQMQRGALASDIPLLAPTLQTIEHVNAFFVGRRAELAWLDEALAQTLGGQGQFILIEGDDGLGKTGLLRTWQSARAAQMLTFAGQAAGPGPGPEPYAPVLDALRQGYEAIDWGWFPARLPWLADLRSALSGPDARVGPEVGVEKLGQFLLAMAGRARRAVGLMLDDLHQADEATWQLLGFLARRCAGTSLLLVGACRPAELPPLARRLIHSLQRQGQVQTLTLLPLSPPDTAKLAQYLLGAKRLRKGATHRLHRATQGNPRRLVELLRDEESAAGFAAELTSPR